MGLNRNRKRELNNLFQQRTTLVHLRLANSATLLSNITSAMSCVLKIVGCILLILYCRLFLSLCRNWKHDFIAFHRNSVRSPLRLLMQIIKLQILQLNTESEMWIRWNLCLVVSLSVSASSQKDGKPCHLKYLFTNLYNKGSMITLNITASPNLAHQN